MHVHLDSTALGIDKIPSANAKGILNFFINMVQSQQKLFKMYLDRLELDLRYFEYGDRLEFSNYLDYLLSGLILYNMRFT